VILCVKALLGSSSPLVQLTELQAHTTYAVHVEACTSAGCTASRTVTLTTSTDLPMNLSAAVVHNITSTSVQLNWTDPVLPNGLILRYTHHIESFQFHTATKVNSYWKWHIPTLSLIRIEIEQQHSSHLITVRIRE